MKYPITVRIDDVCPTMDLEKFDRYIEMLREFGIKPLLGIVPDCQDEQLRVSEVDGFWDYMLRLANDGYSIAMHGVFHKYVTAKPGLVSRRKLSEFSGLSYEEQYEKLRHGLQIMNSHGLNTDIFFAPGHSYDRTTLKALYALGFKYNSDGRSFHAYVLEGIKHIPANGAYRIHFGRGILTICLHPRTESDNSIEKVRAFLSARREKLMNFDEIRFWEEKNYRISRFEEKINMMIDHIIGITVELVRK